jgi:cytidylate kinase
MVARRLGLAYLDTGAMYRAYCWSCLRAGVDLARPDLVLAHCAGLVLMVGTDPAGPTISVDGRELDAELRASEVSEQVSKVATNLPVRALLHSQQRDLIAARTLAGEPGIVVEGRDITTVVAPQAQVRILLTASESARLARRAQQLRSSAAPEAPAAAELKVQVLDRDAQDAAVANFMSAAEGVVELDTSALTLEQTEQFILDLVALAAPGDRGYVLDLRHP